MKPVPVEFNPSNVSEVRINTPCIVQGVDIINAFYSLGIETRLGTNTTSNTISGQISALSSSVYANLTNLSSSISASLLGISASISTSMPPGGNVGSIQFKNGTYQITGSNNFTFDKDFNTLSQGLEINPLIGSYCHAEGHAVTASGYACHAEGFETYANNTSYYSHTEGYRTSTLLAEGAHAEGKGTTTQANYSHAEGIDTFILAPAVGAHAEGEKTWVNGIGSHCEGLNTTTFSTGHYAHTEGYLTTGSANYSHAEGFHTLTSGEASHAEGKYSKTTVTGLYSHVEGAYATGSTEGSHVEGYGCYSENINIPTQEGKYCHIEGFQSHACGDYAHAEGYHTSASGSFSHAEGQETIAIGAGSHASGYNTRAIGACSFSTGNQTRAYGTLSSPQFACGKYNVNSNYNSLFVVGNGTDDVSRKDLFYVNDNDTIHLNGTVVTSVKSVGDGQQYPSGYQITLGDYCIVGYAGYAAFVITALLSAKGTFPVGTTLVIKNRNNSLNNFTITIDQSGGPQTINGSTSNINVTPSQCYRLIQVTSGDWVVI